MSMDIKDGKFYVVSIGKTKTIESDKNQAVEKLVESVKSTTANVEALNPEIVEVDITGEKWQLKTLPWNVIAMELMRMKK